MHAFRDDVEELEDQLPSLPPASSAGQLLMGHAYYDRVANRLPVHEKKFTVRVRRS